MAQLQPRDQLIWCVFRFESEVSVGSGFICRHHVPGHGEITFLVTNRHVAEGSAESVCHTRSNFSLIGSRNHRGEDCIPTPRDSNCGWFAHPDPKIDVAVYKLATDPRIARDREQRFPEYASISTQVFAARSQHVDLVSPVLFVGYPSGIHDAINVVPIFRTGTIASPAELDWQGAPQFLIDASVFPGSSGSPVFQLPEKGRIRFAGQEVSLLGIATASMIYAHDGQLITRPTPVNKDQFVSFKDFLNLGVVTKASCILETIESVLDQRAVLLA